MDDRRLFCDAVYRYYVDLEPEHAWVAVVGPDVARFLVGCIDTAQRARRMATPIVPLLALGLLRGRYRVGRRTWTHALVELGAAARREFPTVDRTQYPAHLHIDAAWRGVGAGAGCSLIEAYLA